MTRNPYTQDPAPMVVPEMEARHLAACRVERIASQVLGHLLAAQMARVGHVSDDALDGAVDTAMDAARMLAERLPK